MFSVCHRQGRSVHVKRVSPANTSKNLLYYFRGSVVLHTLEHSWIDQIKCSSQPGVVSQIVEAYASREQIGASILEL
jgi:hypothetical protein